MTDAEWNIILADLNSLDVERAVAAVEQLDESADETDIPRLRRLVERGQDFFLREAAATPLARLERARALPLLFEAMERGRQERHDNDGLDATITGLFQMYPDEVAPVLIQLTTSSRSTDRANAAWGLGFLSAAVVLPHLLKAAQDNSAEVRGAAVGSLASFQTDDRVFDVLLAALQDRDDSVRVASASSLGYFGDRRAIPPLRNALDDPCERVRYFASYSLTKLDG